VTLFRRRPAPRSPLALAGCSLLLASALLGAGCGLGAGKERTGGVELRVTRDFGERLLAEANFDKVREGDTVMRLLSSERKVKTRFGGGFVQSIDGLAGHGSGGHEDWFYWVNGVEGDRGAADYDVSPGDFIQWDYRDWSETMRIPAIVGAYPEPFLHGTGGKRLPVRVECEDEDGDPCKEVKGRLTVAGAPASSAPLGAASRKQTLRVIVGRWRAARRVGAARTLEQGPKRSGVFARFRDEGKRLQLLDEQGENVRDAPKGTGLVAATALDDQELVWIVTGIDDAGVEAAANALGGGLLRDAFAVAVEPGGPVKLPVGAGAGR
jgi:uncharacterized protein DUF4430